MHCLTQQGYDSAILRFSDTKSDTADPPSFPLCGFFALKPSLPHHGRGGLTGPSKDGLVFFYSKMKTLKIGIRTLDTRRVATLVPDSWRAFKQGGTARGYGYAWQKARLGFLSSNPLCVMCRDDGRVELATVVDHIVPHRGDMSVFWNRSNWQSLCSTHHSSDKQRMERTGQDGGVSESLNGLKY